MMVGIQTITHFGDLALLIPLASVVLVWLLWSRATVAAAWWVLAVVVCAGNTAILKIYFFACPLGDLRSPSGHTSLGTLVYGALAIAIAVQWQGWRRIVVIGVGVLFVGAIAGSRIMSGAHNGIEVVSGLIIGLSTLAVFAVFYLRHRASHVTLWPLLIAVISIVILLNDQEVHAETFLDQLSAFLHIHQSMCA